MRHSHIACHAAALSWMLNRKLKLDPAKEAFIDDDEANGLRSPSPRSVECLTAWSWPRTSELRRTRVVADSANSWPCCIFFSQKETKVSSLRFLSFFCSCDTPVNSPGLPAQRNKNHCAPQADDRGSEQQ